MSLIKKKCFEIFIKNNINQTKTKNLLNKSAVVMFNKFL
jgi:hypothetical protein